MKRAKNIMVIPALIICPVRRMVPRAAEAPPRCLFSTAHMMALVLGDEKSPNPRPTQARLATMKAKPVSAPTKEKRRSPAAERAMPAEARRGGSGRAERGPARGGGGGLTT